jgi:hypothetical protein
VTVHVIRFGGPVSTPVGRLRCFGEAAVETGGALDDERSRMIAAHVTRRLGDALGRARDPGEISAAIAECDVACFADLGIDGARLVRFVKVAVSGEVGPVAVYEGREATALAAGAPVLGLWSGQWHPATVIEIESDRIKVAWDVGDTWAWLERAQIRPRP